MNTPFQKPHPAIRSWAQFGLTILIGAVGFGMAVDKLQTNQEVTQKAVAELTIQVANLSSSVTRNAMATERLDEHLRGVDHRLDRLEQVEEWKRPK